MFWDVYLTPVVTPSNKLECQAQIHRNEDVSAATPMFTVSRCLFVFVGKKNNERLAYKRCVRATSADLRMAHVKD